MEASGVEMPISEQPSNSVEGYTIVGSSVGSQEEMDELLAMAARGEVKPKIQVYDFEEDTINEVLAKLNRGEITGRAVLRLPR